MSDKFKPSSEVLDGIVRLNEYAVIDEEIVEAAAETWRKKPPDPEFMNLLRAKQSKT